MQVGELQRFAEISECRRYRYFLSRRWGPKESGVCWIMLNPSTADAEIDDPTIRRCMAFTQRLGWDAMCVVNLFAYRATDPRTLVEVGAETAMGPDNGGWVRKACHQGALTIAAWGALRHPFDGCARDIVKIIKGGGYSLKCLGKTKDGFPRHPLYLRADAPLLDFA